MTLLLIIIFSGLVSVVFHVPHGIHEWVDTWTRVTAVCSVLHTVLPPWDWQPDFLTGFSEFPSVQKFVLSAFNNRWYRLLIYIIGYLAINGRSTLWAKVISVKKQMADAVAAATNGAPIPIPNSVPISNKEKV